MRNQEIKKSKEKLYCYIRVSSEGQKKGGSIPQQIEASTTFAKKNGYEPVLMKEGKEGVGSSKVERPVHTDILRRIETGEIKNLWYWERSRWSRGGEAGSTYEGLQDTMDALKYFLPYSVNVYEGQYGQKREIDRGVNLILDVIQSNQGYQEGQKIAQRSILGKIRVGKHHGKEGRFLGGTVSYGFKVVDKIYKKDKEESKIVRELFKRYANGESIVQLKNHLDASGIKPRRAKAWNIETIRKMLVNQIYIGVFRWTSKARQWGTGETYTTTVPQIVSHAMFQRVQRRMIDEQKLARRDNTRKTPTLLDGLLQCGSCKSSVTGKVKLYNGKRPDSKTYGCVVGLKKYQQQKHIECDNKRSLNMERTDKFVTEEVSKVLRNSSILKEEFKQTMLEDKNQTKKGIAEEQKSIEKQILKQDKEISNLENTIADLKVMILTKQEDPVVGEKTQKRLLEVLEDMRKSRLEKMTKIDKLNQDNDWIDWVSKYISETDLEFNKSPREAIKGLVSKIVAFPELDKVSGKQIGHKLKINFNLPIVKDTIVYKDPDDKTKGYELKVGRRVKSGSVDFNKGGNPNLKKNSRKGRINQLPPANTFQYRRISLQGVVGKTAVPHLCFTITSKSGDLTYNQPYSKRQQTLHRLISFMNKEEKIGYRTIARKFNSWGIKTTRGKTWSSASVHSVLKKKIQRDERIGDREKEHPTKLENFRVEYFYA